MGSVPSSNLLVSALTVIKPQEFTYRRFTGRALNDIGLYVSTYAAPQTLKGSIQSVPRSVYNELGLDWKKKYLSVYCSDMIDGIDRDTSGDLIEFNNLTWQALSEGGWQPIDNWAGILFIQVDDPTVAP